MTVTDFTSIFLQTYFDLCINDVLVTISLHSRYMVTCADCPNIYPWVWDSTGLGLDRDVYQLFNADPVVV